MSRQINLYDATLRQQRDLLSAHNVVLATLLVLLLVTTGAGMARWSVASRARDANTVNTQLQAARTAFTELSQALSSLKADPGLQAEVEMAQRNLKSAQSALNLLRGMTGKPPQPAAAGMLQALSRAGVDGLWLTRLVLLDGGKQLEIRGRMTDQALLPAYLRRLESEPAFQGRHFAALDMKGAEWLPPTANGARPGDFPKATVDGQKAAENKAERWFVEFALRSRDVAKPASEGAAK